MIKVFLVVIACMAPNYTYCEWMESVEMSDPETCQLTRPVAAGVFQLQLPEGSGWRTFTRCELINPEENGRLG